MGSERLKALRSDVGFLEETTAAKAGECPRPHSRSDDGKGEKGDAGHPPPWQKTQVHERAERKGHEQGKHEGRAASDYEKSKGMIDGSRGDEDPAGANGGIGLSISSGHLFGPFVWALPVLV